MPIPFSSIPEHIQFFILRKLDVNGYPRFCMCSLEAFKLAKNSKNPLTLSVDRCEITKDEWCHTIWQGTIHFKLYLGTKIYHYCTKRILDFPCQLIAKYIPLHYSMPLDKEMCDFVFNTKSTVRVCFLTSVTCTTEEFNSFLEITGVMELAVVYGVIWPEYLRVPAMKNLEFLRLEHLKTDDDLLALEVPKLDVYGTKLNSSGINLLLKECLKAKRKINTFLSSTADLDEDEIFNGILYNKGWPSGDGNVYYISNYENDITVTYNEMGGYVKIQSND